MSRSFSNPAECEAAGLDPKAVDRIAKRLGRAARDARRLGLTVFGGAGSGSLRFRDGDGASLIVGEMNDGAWDGGDGGATTDASGLLRGEYI